MKIVKSITNDILYDLKNEIKKELKDTFVKSLEYVFESNCDGYTLQTYIKNRIYFSDMIPIFMKVIEWSKRYTNKNITKDEFVKTLESVGKIKLLIGTNIVVISKKYKKDRAGVSIIDFCIDIKGLQANQIFYVINKIINKGIDDIIRVSSSHPKRYIVNTWELISVIDHSRVTMNDFISDKKELILNSVKMFDKKKKIFMDNNLIYNYNILLHGVPGTGKTLIARIIADYYDGILITFNSNSNISEFFNFNFVDTFREEIKQNKKFIFLFDELDIIMAQASEDRYASKGESVNTKLEAMLKVLDGELSVDNSISIITTNKINDIDERVLRSGRIDLSVELTDLDYKYALQLLNKFTIPKETYKDIFEMYMKDINPNLKDISLDEIKKYHYNPAKLENVIVNYLINL